MKKTLSAVLALAMTMGVLTACGSSGSTAGTSGADQSAETSEAAGMKDIDKLTVAFVPSKDPDEIVTATEPLKGMLQEELAGLGYNVKEVDITVGTNYEAVGEALSAGTADVGLIPGGTYVMYDDGAEVILTATRNGLTKDSDNPADWNDGQPDPFTDEQVTYYRALILAGPSEKGKELADKVNSGEELTWDDLDSATWAVMSTTSPAGYIYPSIWLQDHYGKAITDLSNVVTSDSYGSTMARLASGQIDVMVSYADVRNDYEKQWNSEYGRDGSIWEEVEVIGVTPGIYNDTVSVSRFSPIMDDDFKAALQQAFINIGNTEEGKKVISIYSHNGYQIAKDSDYDNERKAQEIIRSMNE
ncbi:MAG TPA: phosphate/phosphite/phosphonate ABC transporter substrate-binding protein [Candidatus Lachnoclostridium pullistercoris]|uniref:Phosphate/phosphite/phosphonate ABC transporter substrate-binding protein n=1 Tax=Candidatus Lachnoclostridium pullistercoris TaxID=2838632 RepID=A0A9D2T547_9FIRM|nr:phosphate/phosphite/phosphonate ABC transporter substrate-binding protein [Candidatus Lachnoclostridium pullistercoris]